MIEADKSDCTDTLTFGLHRTKLWRERMLVKYPSDARNGRAAESLAKLAVDAKDLTDEAWSQLKPYSGWASESFRESISTAARMVGFQKRVHDLPTFVDCLIGVLRS
jgi:hypothetical protein